MRAPSSHMNGGSHELNLWWDPPFMWEEGVRIYGTPGMPNNFPQSCVYHRIQKIIDKHAFIAYWEWACLIRELQLYPKAIFSLLKQFCVCKATPHMCEGTLYFVVITYHNHSCFTKNKVCVVLGWPIARITFWGYLVCL